jgi:hypothetical protein
MKLKGLRFKIQSLVVKSMIVNGKIIHRHFFEWYDRSELSMCYVRLTLIRQNGTTIGQTYELKFPTVKQLGTVTVEERGQQVQKPYYNVPVYFDVDADEIAIGFDYYTATVLKKSDPLLDVISLKREDFTQLL